MCALDIIFLTNYKISRRFCACYKIYPIPRRAVLYSKYIVTFVPLSSINSAVEKDMLSMDRTLRTYRKIDERIPTSIHLVDTEGEISKYKVV